MEARIFKQVLSCGQSDASLHLNSISGSVGDSPSLRRSTTIRTLGPFTLPYARVRSF